MSRTRRNSLLVLIVGVLVTGLSLVALAAEEEGGEEEPVGGPTTTVEPSGLTPAVPMEGEQEAAAEVDWTYRYLIPTGLALAAIIVLVTSVKYFTDVVRKRYRMVE